MSENLVTAGAITKCGMCGQKFDLHAPLPVGKGLDRAPESERKLMGLIWRLGDHLSRAHKEENRVLEYRAAEFLGMLRILEFRSTEPELLKQIDLLRWTILQKVISVRLTDEVIAADAKVFADMVNKEIVGLLQTAAAEGTVPLVHEKITALLEFRVKDVVTKYRDMVEEPNKWVVPPPSATPVEAQKATPEPVLDTRTPT